MPTSLEFESMFFYLVKQETEKKRNRETERSLGKRGIEDKEKERESKIGDRQIGQAQQHPVTATASALERPVW